MKNESVAVGLAAFAVCIAALSSSAQQPSPIGEDDGRDDIVFIVKLTAKELKMDTVPTPTVEFPGTHRRATAWLTERTNLPDKLEPGVTYRDIGMTLRISSRFENIDEIVREALGEPPADAKAAPAAAPAPSTEVGALPQKRKAAAKRRTKNN